MGYLFLVCRYSRKRTPVGGPFIREHRGSGPEKQKPKHNPCWPVGRDWKKPLPGAREKSGTCLQCVCQRFTQSSESQMVFQLDPWFLLGGIDHHKHWSQNMCYTHNWPQQTSIVCNWWPFHGLQFWVTIGFCCFGSPGATYLKIS